MISFEKILFLHFKIIEDFGGSHGVRDESRVQSALEAPFQEAFGQELYTTIFAKATVYLRSIVGDHPFFAGNKRTAIALAGVYLNLNKMELSATPKELEDFAVQVAIEHLEIPVIADWLRQHSVENNS